MGEQIKVVYVVRDGTGTTTSKAYIDDETFVGTDKYTNIDVELRWSDLNYVWEQVDTWEWDFDMFGEPHRRKE